MNIFLLILGMSLVTYIPRALPALFMSKIKMNEPMERFLSYIPYAAIGALIVPGVFTIDHHLIPAIIAVILACILSVWKKNMVITIVTTTLIYILLQLILY